MQLFFLWDYELYHLTFAYAPQLIIKDCHSYQLGQHETPLIIGFLSSNWTVFATAENLLF